jgi:ATP synthase F1 gamma subunit
MRRSNELSDQQSAMSTLVELTSAFEGIASLRIAQIRSQVLASQLFFDDLWKIYNQLRVDEFFHFGRLQSAGKVNPKELLILITGEGSFSGDIDKRLVEKATADYNPAKQDIVVVGSHGATQLQQRGVKIQRSFKEPEEDLKINTAPLAEEVKKYASTIIYSQQYQSLMNQVVKKRQLSTAVMERGSKVDKPGEVINEMTYIFEPSAFAVVNHLENSMMQITLSELILESKLAQYASRFKAMSLAHDRARDNFTEVSNLYNRARRQEKDERLKETMNNLRRAER